MLVYRVYIYDDSLTIMFTTQDTYYKKEDMPISELESSFMGNQPPPRRVFVEPSIMKCTPNVRQKS